MFGVVIGRVGTFNHKIMRCVDRSPLGICKARSTGQRRVRAARRWWRWWRWWVKIGTGASSPIRRTLVGRTCVVTVVTAPTWACGEAWLLTPLPVRAGRISTACLLAQLRRRDKNHRSALTPRARDVVGKAGGVALGTSIALSLIHI